MGLFLESKARVLKTEPQTKRALLSITQVTEIRNFDTCEIIRVMNTKLTLTIDDNLVSEAKKYAKSVNRSLSDLVSSYLNTIVKEPVIHSNLHLNELIGCISHTDENYKTLKGNYLAEKYGIQ